MKSQDVVSHVVFVIYIYNQWRVTYSFIKEPLGNTKSWRRCKASETLQYCWCNVKPFWNTNEHMYSLWNKLNCTPKWYPKEMSSRACTVSIKRQKQKKQTKNYWSTFVPKYIHMSIHTSTVIVLNWNNQNRTVYL